VSRAPSRHITPVATRRRGFFVPLRSVHTETADSPKAPCQDAKLSRSASLRASALQPDILPGQLNPVCFLCLLW